MEFEPVNNPDHPVFRRLIVDKQAAQYVTGRYLLEARTRLEDGDDGRPNYEVHSNLIVPESDLTIQQAASQIWQDYTLKSFGKEANMHPRIRQKVPYEAQLSPSKSKIGANHYIGQDKAAQIAGWTNKIDEEAPADPYTAAPEPSAEQTATRRRKVVVDSDDEDGDDKDHQLVSLKQEEPDKVPEQPIRAADRFGAQLGLLPAEPHSSKRQYELPEDRETTTDTFFPKPAKSMVLGSTLGSDLLQTADMGSTAAISGLPHVPEVRAAVPDVVREAGNTQRRVLADSDSDAASDEEADDLEVAKNEARLTALRADLALKTKDSTSTAAVENPNATENDAAVGETHDQWKTVVSSKKAKSAKAKTKVPRAINHMDGAYSTSSDHSLDDKSSITDAAGLATSVSWPSKGFNANAYGHPNRGSKGSRSSAATSPEGNPSTKPPLHISKPKSPHALHDKSKPQPSRSRGSYLRGRGGSTVGGRHEQTSSDSLIDISDTAAPKPAAPPPGLNIRIPKPTEEPLQSPEAPSLLDSPVDFFEDRSPTRHTQSDLISLSSASRPTDYSDQSANYVNDRAYKGPNIKAIKNQHLSKLYAMEAEQQQKEAAVQAKKTKTQENRKQHKAVEDGYNRSFHSTMSQKTGNPGKKGGKSRRGGSSVGQRIKPESAAERQERLATAMREAYGAAASDSQTKAPPVKPRVQNLADMSAKKRQLLKTNTHMATANADALQQNSQQKAVTDLISHLTPVFEAARAFSGDLKFCIELGQVLISHDSQIDTGKVYTSKGWSRLFGAAAKVTPPPTTFTNRITTNGAEVDRALGIKQGAAQMWDYDPARNSVTYNFHCQSKHGTEFWLVLHEDGTYKVCHSETVVGQVALHVPGQVWDACAVLTGLENWEEPPILITGAVAAFLETVYVVPNRRELALTFRHPSNNEITVKDVFIERTSCHQCLLPDHHNYEIKVTEAKELYNKVHPQDRKLWQVYEKSYLEMVADGQLHYELSISDCEINDALLANKNLELGETTSVSSTDKSLLTSKRIEQLVHLTSETLMRTNWLGAQNDGTLTRAARFQEDQQMRQQQSMPPMARSRLNQILPASRMNSRPGGSTVTGAQGGSETYLGMRTLHGTRRRTQAEVYEDESGNRYAKGMGGARIPVPEQSLMGGGTLGAIEEGEVLPDDSASQIGVRKVVRTGVSGRSRGIHDDKPPGFW